MTPVRDLALDAAIPEHASFREAVDALAASAASAVALVTPDGRVVGLLDERQILKGLFPAYLDELTHTAFAEDDDESIARRRETAMSTPAREFAADAVTVEVDSSFTHVTERFMHCGLQGIAVVDNGRYRGVLSLDRYVRALLSTHD
jgi:CBS domain-containing protein